MYEILLRRYKNRCAIKVQRSTNVKNEVMPDHRGKNK